MKLAKLFIVLALAFGIKMSVEAQDLLKLIGDKDKSFYEIQEAIESNKGIMDNASPSELKRYYRWLWYWDRRVCTQGNFYAAVFT